MDRAELARRIKEIAYLTGQFKLRSGQSSSFYLDKYRFESDPELLGAVVDALIEKLPETCDRIAGLALGGIPLVTGVALKLGKPCLFVRKTPKQYGTKNLIEGPYEKGERVVVIEDIVTTAGQLARSVRQMREFGLEVTDVLCVIDREQGGYARLAKAGVRLLPVFTMEALEALAREAG
jgi:orotate phosphoribosyltransferase